MFGLTTTAESRRLATAFSALRTYALCTAPYRRFAATAVFALAVVPLIINMIVRFLRMSQSEVSVLT